MTTSDELSSSDAIAAWLGTHLTKGEGMRRPYYGKWENGGCSPKYSLRTWPSDRLAILADGLASLEYPVFGIENGVIVETAVGLVRVSADQVLMDRPPKEFVLQVISGPVNYVGDSPEVIVELLRGLGMPPSQAVATDILDIGFPGHHDDEATYVGSWQWAVHGEARGLESVDRAAAATLAAIGNADKRNGLR